MAPRYDEAPELTPQHLPEVHYPPTAPEFAGHPQQYPFPIQAQTPGPKPDDYSHHGYTPIDHAGSSMYGYENQSSYGTNSASRPMNSAPSMRAQRKKRYICGCSGLVFTLSMLIAILSAAVIGLAAGTGVQAGRANTAESKLAAASSSLASLTGTASPPSSTSASFDRIDRNCSSSSSTVSGTTYTSQFFNMQSFKVFCNKDAPNPQLSSLFVANFDDCIDACASYSYYAAMDFPTAGAQNVTCAGVSFIPLWTDRDKAKTGGAPGNCYLKPGPQNQSSLATPNIGTECHAAILAS